jgi:hypothetical protein
MSRESFLSFLTTARDDRVMLTRYTQRNLSQLLFHAKNDGFDFSVDDITALIGKLEIGVILTKDREAVNGDSTLWRHMWGRTYLEYLVEHVVERFSDQQLRALAQGEAA